MMMVRKIRMDYLIFWILYVFIFFVDCCLGGLSGDYGLVRRKGRIRLGVNGVGWIL